MKVNQEQIAALYAFTRKHYVEFYDLQTELVDHLANAIEAQWEKNPEIPFEEALQIEFKKFGIFGFTEIVEQRQNALHKRYLKIIWQQFKSFFKLPKIIGSVGSVYLLYLVFRNYEKLTFVLWLLLLLHMVASFVYMIVQKQKQFKQKEDRKFIFKELIYTFGINSLVMQVPVQLFVFFDNSAEGVASLVGAFTMATLIVCYLLYTYITFFVIPKNAEKYLNEVYPEYKFMQQA
ncbi:hypothetical protein SAMN05216480_101148 [Pustulibacterium marinum]|uniref:Uncharacterized protein n=1 Tax=Pustulibacterium marinum TaxID=1224947 RepID=A0A1I7ETW9_9FLAO|nr:hypothetical protein [Pustulibacterium marinum]SFU27360.1 hypothetical protein SAMN05216480_101148 [Pustulibacterium marinum]